MDLQKEKLKKENQEKVDNRQVCLIIFQIYGQFIKTRSTAYRS